MWRQYNVPRNRREATPTGGINAESLDEDHGQLRVRARLLNPDRQLAGSRAGAARDPESDLHIHSAGDHGE